MVDKKTLDEIVKSKKPFTKANKEKINRREKYQTNAVKPTIYATNPNMIKNIGQGFPSEDVKKVSSELEPDDNPTSVLKLRKKLESGEYFNRK